MLDAMARYFPDTFSWSKPDGGMFIWAQGPDGLDMERLYEAAISRNTAFLPGKFIYTEPGEGHATMRLNFTMSDEVQIDGAVSVLGELIREAG
jgi:2-aminoadipate transaminase